MGRKAGIISIDLVAGTAKFNADMANASAKVREFGTHSVSGVQAASGAIRVVEGNIQNNVRAVERFMVSTLKMGPILQAAFPLVGGIAFAGMVFKIGEEVVQFFKKMEQAPQRIAGAFRELNAPLRLANDELQVTNDRLANEIAKLEGKHQNTLKLALDEAVVSADKLAISLEKDISNMNKLLKEENISDWKALLGKAPTSDITKEFGGETGTGGFFAKVASVNDEGDAKIRAAQTKDAQNAARTELNTRLTKLYGDELQKVNRWLAEAQELAKPRVGTVFDPKTGRGMVQNIPGADEAARIELLTGAARNLRSEMAGIGLNSTNADLMGKKAELEPLAAQKLKDQEALNRLNEELVKIKDKHLEGLERIASEEEAEIARLVTAKSLSQKDLDSGKVNAGNNSLLAVLQQVTSAKTLDLYFETIEKYNKSLEVTEGKRAEAQKERTAASQAAVKKFFEESLKDLERMDKAVAKLNEEYRKIVVSGSQQDLQHRVEMVGITGQRSDPVGTLAKQQDLERADIQKHYNDSLEEANSTLKGAELILTRQNLLSQKNLDLHRLDAEMEAKKAADASTISGNIAAGARDAKSPQEIANEAINSSEDKLSDQLTKLITGQKTSFAQMFKEVGDQMLKETIKSGLQKGLGAIGAKFGIHKDKPVTFRAGDPGHVIVDNWGSSKMSPGNVSGPQDQNNGPLGLGRIPVSGIAKAFGFLGKLFGSGGGGGGGDTPDVSSTFTPMAAGGSVSASQAYMVGEHGPEILTGASGRIMSHSDSQRALGGGGDNHFYTIDARGTDPVLTEQRTRQAIMDAHNSAVSKSVQVSSDRLRRMPAGAHA